MRVKLWVEFPNNRMVFAGEVEAAELFTEDAISQLTEPDDYYAD